jgi:3-hydroxybutyryl-CoA dehydrogenase
MKIGIIGAGTMGSGIAQVSAMAGFETVLCDINADALRKAETNIAKHLTRAIELRKISVEAKQKCLNKIFFTSDIESVKADLVIEAIVEQLEPKAALFNRLAEINNPSCLFATNTSSIPVTKLASRISNPERVIGIHFFNPAHVMKLVEIVKGTHTSEYTLQMAKDFVLSIGKVSILAHDSPGFIVNRVARHYYIEALKVLEEDVTNFESIDRLMESSGFKMGPFRLMDIIGVDTNFSVTGSMFELFHQDPRFRPSRIQEQKVQAGFHGRKNGRGFYDYV